MKTTCSRCDHRIEQIGRDVHYCGKLCVITWDGRVVGRGTTYHEAASDEQTFARRMDSYGLLPWSARA